MDIISPYFVPGDQAADALCKQAGKGVEVRILTNSLASNDVSAVHARLLKVPPQAVTLWRAAVRTR